VIAASIYFSYLQSNFNSWIRYRETRIAGINNSFLTRAYAANMHRYPGFKQLALSFSEWSKLGAQWDDNLVDEYTSAVLQAVAELEQQEPDPSADVIWCGMR
jgi:hypothetical protein